MLGSQRHEPFMPLPVIVGGVRIVTGKVALRLRVRQGMGVGRGGVVFGGLGAQVKVI